MFVVIGATGTERPHGNVGAESQRYGQAGHPRPAARRPARPAGAGRAGAPQPRAPVAEGAAAQALARPQGHPDRRLRRRPPHRRSRTGREPARPRLAGPARPGLPRSGHRRPQLPAPGRRLQRQRPLRRLLVQAGTATDVLWYGGSDGAFAGASATVNGSYRPFTGDFNGDRTDDVFWYRPGGGAGVVLVRARRDASPAARCGTYQPLVADFNGDGRRDILWYGPAPATTPSGWAAAAAGSPAGPSRSARATSRCWATGTATAAATSSGTGPAPPTCSGSGGPTRRFGASRSPWNGTYAPFTGDFNGDRRRDILWYGPGAGRDVAWYGRADGRFGHLADRARHLPALCGRLRGRRPPRRPLVRRATPTTSSGSGTPTALHLPGDHHRHRLHPGPAAAPRGAGQPVRPSGSWPAFGAIDGHAYSNSLEGVPAQLRARLPGLRDRPGPPGRRHRPAPTPGLEANYGLGKPFKGDLGRPGRAPLPGPVHGPAQPGPGPAAARAPRRLLHPRLQVVAAGDLPDHPAPGAGAERARAPPPARRGPGRADRLPHRLPAPELHGRPVPHPGPEPVRRPGGGRLHPPLPGPG